MSALSALVVLVPEAEPHVAGLRQRFDASARLGVSAHITILAPFMPPERIDHRVLEQIAAAFARVPAFPFQIFEVCRFVATTYLAPVPADPFIRLTESVASVFPDYPPFSGQHSTIVPHLTVAHGDAPHASVAADELSGIMKRQGAINAYCSSVVLLQNASGLWQQMGQFPLCQPGIPHTV